MYMYWVDSSRSQCRYLEIESREVPCTDELLYMDPKKAVDWADENTIGICAILGSTVSV